MFTQEQIDRFKAKVAETANPDECWYWRGYVAPGGYGHCTIARKSHDVHRVAFAVAYGGVPDGLEVLHTCDNRTCCNPNHLFSGTQKDNVDDMVAKGRNKAPLGEQHGKHLLTAAEVQSIRRIRSDEGKSLAHIAKAFSVSVGCIRKVVNRVTWKHI